MPARVEIRTQDLLHVAHGRCQRYDNSCYNTSQNVLAMSYKLAIAAFLIVTSVCKSTYAVKILHLSVPFLNLVLLSHKCIFPHISSVRARLFPTRSLLSTSQITEKIQIAQRNRLVLSVHSNQVLLRS